MSFLRGAIILLSVHLIHGKMDPDYGYFQDENNGNYEVRLEPMSFTSRDHQPDLVFPDSRNTSDSINESSEDRQYFEASEQEYITNVSMKPSEESTQEKFESKLSPFQDYIFGCFLVTICFLSLLGNGIILLVFWFRHRRLSPVEVFLANLGIVDILLSLASYPMSTISSFKHHWAYGEFGCAFYGFTCYFLGLACISSVTGIAMIRYVMTCTASQGNRITCWTSCKIILWGYLFSLVWALLPLAGFGHYGVEPYGLSCTLDWTASDTASSIYIGLVSIFCVFLPLFIIGFCYTKIILLVKQSNSLMQTCGVQKRSGKGSDMHLTWISGLVTVGFLIGWCPYSIVSLWASFRGDVILPMWATPIPVILAKSSIAYNPFIYFFLTARYRDDLKTVTRNWMTWRRSEAEIHVDNKRKCTPDKGERCHGRQSEDDTSGGGCVTSTTHLIAYYSTPTLGKQEKSVLLEEVHDDNSSGEKDTLIPTQEEKTSCQSYKETEANVVTILEKSGTVTVLVASRLGRKVGSHRVTASQEMEHQV